jgi:hypothetical protein
VTQVLLSLLAGSVVAGVAAWTIGQLLSGLAGVL